MWQLSQVQSSLELILVSLFPIILPYLLCLIIKKAIIASRFSAYTYGVGTAHLFEEGVDPVEKKVTLYIFVNFHFELIVFTDNYR